MLLCGLSKAPQAIEHLGSDKIEIRLGGIYALARIAQDSPRDHWPIMQVLCAFVKNSTAKINSSQPSSDVQAILDVLGARSYEFETDEQHLDLTAVNLKGASLRSAFLDGARFDDSNLEDVDLMRATAC